MDSKPRRCACAIFSFIDSLQDRHVIFSPFTGSMHLICNLPTFILIHTIKKSYWILGESILKPQLKGNAAKGKEPGQKRSTIAI
jgi:hypothetical protein